MADAVARAVRRLLIRYLLGALTLCAASCTTAMFSCCGDGGRRNPWNTASGDADTAFANDCAVTIRSSSPSQSER